MTPPFDVIFDCKPRLTDDTQLTLAICEGIVAARGIDPECLATAMARWFRERRLTGLGASTFKALQELAAGHHWALTGAKGDRAAGNGAAMRIAPLAFYLNLENFDDRALLRDVARITHHHEEAYVGALAVAGAVQFATSSEQMSNLIGHVAGLIPDSVTRDRLMFLTNETEIDLAACASRFGTSGYVADTVPLVILGASKLDTLGFIDVLAQLIECGGDTDTVASIAGQIMGARIGYSQLPYQLIERLEERESILAIADSVANYIEKCDCTGIYDS